MLDEKKEQIAKLSVQIQNVNIERERLNDEQKSLLKELTNMLNKFESNGLNAGFKLEEAVSIPTKMVTKNIIMASDSDSSSDSDSDSDSSDAPKVLQKKAPPKGKGGPKGLKLGKPASDSDSDEESS